MADEKIWAGSLMVQCDLLVHARKGLLLFTDLSGMVLKDKRVKANALSG